MLKIGDKAPDFTVLDQNGQSHSLSQYIGSKLVLYFYPKDNTPGCTAQACNLRDHYAILKQKGIVLLGLSTDTVSKHKKFETQYKLPFPLLADTDKHIVNLYGVWAEKKFMGRTYMGILRWTFLINEEGVIVHIIDKVTTKDHTKQILDFWSDSI